METRYSSHAVDRMIERRISTAEVAEILTRPDGLIWQSEDKVIAYKQIAGRRDNALAIVAVERAGDFDVITVMVNFEVAK